MYRKANSKTNIFGDDLRLNLLLLGFFSVCILFILKLFVIQLVDHRKYRAMAEEQYWDSQTLPAKRGDVLTSDGYMLATTQVSYLMYAEPEKVVDKLGLSQGLAQDLYDIRKQTQLVPNIVVEDLTKEATSTENKAEYIQPKELTAEDYFIKFTEYLSKDLMWVSLGQILTPEQKDYLLSKNYTGIGFEEISSRYYPESTLAAHVLGFVASNEKGEPQGYFGIEGSMDGDLRGKPGKIVQEQDALGAPILFGGYQRVNSINGRSVYLTLNRSVQYIVEKRLKESIEKYGAKSGTVVVMDPFTGDILAMANYPTFDPAWFGREGENIQRTNLSISQTYEPGSVIKPLTVASAIDLDRVTPETTYMDEGPVQYSDYYIDNWDRKHLGQMNIIQLLQKSNNIGAAWVGTRVGAEKLSDYFMDFGYGKRTGIDLEGEDTGVINDYKNWTEIDLATASFGQGISATPLQVLTSFNVFANGGYLVKPRIVSKFVDEGKVTEIPTKRLHKVISDDTAKTMDFMLAEAASGGESKYFNLKNYKIAGKTGTAQIPVDGKYDPTKTNATFVGYPAVSKKFSMIVKLEEPSTSPFAAETAVPLWMQLTDDLVKYYGIAPDLAP